MKEENGVKTAESPKDGKIITKHVFLSWNIYNDRSHHQLESLLATNRKKNIQSHIVHQQFLMSSSTILSSSLLYWIKSLDKRNRSLKENIFFSSVTALTTKNNIQQTWQTAVQWGENQKLVSVNPDGWNRCHNTEIHKEGEKGHKWKTWIPNHYCPSWPPRTV